MESELLVLEQIFRGRFLFRSSSGYSQEFSSCEMNIVASVKNKGMFLLRLVIMLSVYKTRAIDYLLI